MDPQACWERVIASLRDGDVRDARLAAHDLATWIKRGGFRPAEIGQARTMRQIMRQARAVDAAPIYLTTYCNRWHEIERGRPIGHECHVLPPAAIRAEMRGEFEEAIGKIERAKPLRTHGGVK